MSAVKREREVDDPTIIKLTDIEHVHAAADMFVGQRLHALSPPVCRFVYNPETQHMEFMKDIIYPAGLLKLFDEAISNASDNTLKKNNPCTKIQVRIDRGSNLITIWNNGDVFSITPTEHPSRYDSEKKAFQPELAFFHCRASSNYHKKQRVSSGKNGLGIKLASILSLRSELIVCDGTTYYKQGSSQYMNYVSAPIVKPATKAMQGKPFLQFTFQPDLALFYPEKEAPATFSDLLMRLFLSRTYDIAGTTPKTAKVFYAKDKDPFVALPIKTFKDYVHLFVPDGDKELQTGYFECDRWQVCLIRNPFPQDVRSVSFVNGTNTYQGGTHVKFLYKQVFSFCKDSLPQVDRHRVERLVMLFVNCTIEDPSFTSQTKEELVTAPEKFGSNPQLDNRCLNVIKRSGILKDLQNALEQKETKRLQQEIGVSKRGSVHDIPNIRDANWAGKKSKQCTLFLVEGGSALQLATIAIGILGGDRFGAMALQGKFINATNKTKIEDNKEFRHICRMIGLVPRKKMTRSELRYHNIVLLTDQDVDGAHITGLFLYLLYKCWPELLQEKGFVSTFITPIVVATVSLNKRIPFYSLPEYHEWCEKTKTKHTTKYYKGLATSTSKEAKEYFGPQFQRSLKPYEPLNDEDAKSLELAMSQKKGDARPRQEWLKTFNEKDYLIYSRQSSIRVHDFVHKSFKHFSWASVCRGLPMLQDGLTISQRKCLHYMLQHNVTEDEKVSSLQGKIAADCNYHHGSASLEQTITRMAQDFVCKQNINLLVPSGQFGMRADGGSVTGSARYIFTHVHPIARFIFRKEDDAVLPKQWEEGMEIEFACYAPIIPFLLINGAQNIGTGFTSNIPCYRPQDWIQIIRLQLQNQDWKEPKPWYRGFLGTIEMGLLERAASDDMETDDPSKLTYHSIGKVECKKDCEYHITELPVRVWSTPYKNFLENLEQTNQIKSFSDYGTETTIHFVVQTLAPLENPVKFFRLAKNHKTALNSTALVKDRLEICSFASVRDMFITYFDFRLSVYEKRRQHLIKEYEADIPFKACKVQFIQAILQGRLRLGQKRSVMKQAMTQLQLPEEYHTRLLDLSVSTFTEERMEVIQQELAEVQQRLAYYQKIKPEELWLQDLAELELALSSSG